ncbi:MAG: hypothetical protein ACE15B_12565 [Bryobacteraceae bacterium]
MNPDEKHPPSRWTREEIQKAEATATRFLEENGSQIAETLRAKVRFLEALTNRLASKKTTLDQRLDCFARISEIADLLKEDADGFFSLASQPVVARILANVKK